MGNMHAQCSLHVALKCPLIFCSFLLFKEALFNIYNQLLLKLSVIMLLFKMAGNGEEKQSASLLIALNHCSCAEMCTF